MQPSKRQHAPVFTLDTREQALCCDGEPLAVTPKALALLRLFVEHPGRLLDKAEILSRVWPDARVTQASIKDYVKSLRQALRDDPAQPRYIETVRGRGYRYIGDIALVEGRAPSANSRDAVGAVQPVVAVLPLINLSGDPSCDYFVRGVAEDLITGLSRYRQLLVIAPQSSLSHEGGAADIEGAGAALGADWIVTGSLRRDEAQLHLAAQLVEARSGRRVWAHRYDRPAHEVLVLENEVVRAIVATAVGCAEQADTERALRKPPAELNAYDTVLCARHKLATGVRADVLEARSLLLDATARCPDYATAYSWLAETYYVEALSPWCLDPEAAEKRVLELGRIAVGLDPLDSMAHLCLAWGYFRAQRSLEMAKAQLAIALELNPNDYYGLCFEAILALCSGALDGAVASAEQALRRSPLAPDACLSTLGFASYFGGRYERAIDAFCRMRTPSADIYAGIAACQARLARHAQAAEAAHEFRACIERSGRRFTSADPQRWRDYWQGRFMLCDPRFIAALLDDLARAGLPGR